MGSIKAINFLHSAPLTVLIVFGLLLILAEAFTKGSRSFLMGLTVAGCVSTLGAVVLAGKLLGGATPQIFGKMLIVDNMALFAIGLFTVVTAMTAMMSAAHQTEHRWETGEYYGRLMLSTAGMAMIAMSNDLVALFLGVETMSIAVYVLTASRRRSRRGAEGAMKYFLMGAFATGFLLYGMALVYGATGTTNMTEIAASTGQEPSGLLMIGIFMLVIAFAFKIAAIPFHMWAPDAYEGAPTPVTGFMAAGVKAAAFIGIIRLFGDTFGGEVLPFGRMGWSTIFAVLAAITMTVGNIAALRQQNIKRMLAYSSISHAGVLLVGVVAMGIGAADARSSVLFYLLAYSITTMGAFAVIAWIGARDHERILVDDWAGLAGKHPGAALAMTIFMLSLAGMPPTAGFLGKFVIFKSAALAHDQQLLWLVIIGVLNSAISIYYYLRVVMAMYFRDALGEFKPLRSGALVFVLILCALAVLQMGIMPGRWLGYAS